MPFDGSSFCLKSELKDIPKSAQILFKTFISNNYVKIKLILPELHWIVYPGFV